MSHPNPLAGTQGGAAAKQVRFDTTLAAGSSAGATGGFGGSLTALGTNSAGAGATTLAGLLAAPLTTVGGFAPTGGGLLGQLGATSTATALNLSMGFGQPTQALQGATSTAGLGRGLGGFGFGSTLLGAGRTCASQMGALGSNVGLGGTSAVGQTLGGVGVSVSACGQGTATSSGSKSCDPKALKEMEMPAEIKVTVDDFMKYVKEQRTVREEIARMSSKPLFQVEEDVKNLRQHLLVISSALQRCKASVDKLKQDSTRDLRHAEIAQRTKDTPPGLQFENTAPCDYFQRLIDDFNCQLTVYRKQIADTEAHLLCVGTAGSTAPLTSQELSALFSRLDDGFLSVASRLHSIHEAARVQIEAYVRYRKMFHGDVTAGDVFDQRRKCREMSIARVCGPPPTTVGLSPFSLTSRSTAGLGTASSVCAGGMGASGVQLGGQIGGLTGFGQTGSSGLGSGTKFTFGASRPLG